MIDSLNVLILLNNDCEFDDFPVQQLFEKLAKLSLIRHLERAPEALSPEARNFDKVYKAFEVSVLLTGDAEIHELNKRFRGVDKATNVLSFPALEEYRKQVFLLGDIVISIQTIKREAAEQAKTVKEHLSHMFVHSILHLIGYDHQNKAEMDDMEALEDEILSYF